MYQVIPIYMSEKCMALKGNKKYVLLNNRISSCQNSAPQLLLIFDFVVCFFYTGIFLDFT